MRKQNNITRYSICFLITLLAGCSEATSNNENDRDSQTKSSNEAKEQITVISDSDNQNTESIEVDTGIASGIQVQSSFLKNLVIRSDLIFRGKLTEISQGLSIEEIPYTFVTYDVEEVITGQYPNATITLKFVGGEFPNGNRLSATNTPDVQLGEQSILMVQQSKNTGCDFVECEHGRFVLEDGKIIAANESAIIVDDKGGVDYISFTARQNGKHKSSLARSNIPRFISHLKSLDKTFLTQRKSARTSVINTDKYLPFKAYPALTRAKGAPQVPKSQIENKPRKLEGSHHDQWEVEQLKRNGGNPVLNTSYSNDQN